MTEELTTGVPEKSDNTQPTENGLQFNGNEEPHWYSSLSEEYRNHPSIQKFQDVNGMAKSYLSLESLMG